MWTAVTCWASFHGREKRVQAPHTPFFFVPRLLALPYPCKCVHRRLFASFLSSGDATPPFVRGASRLRRRTLAQRAARVLWTSVALPAAWRGPSLFGASCGPWCVGGVAVAGLAKACGPPTLHGSSFPSWPAGPQSKCSAMAPCRLGGHMPRTDLCRPPHMHVLHVEKEDVSHGGGHMPCGRPCPSTGRLPPPTPTLLVIGCIILRIRGASRRAGRPPPAQALGTRDHPTRTAHATPTFPRI